LSPDANLPASRLSSFTAADSMAVRRLSNEELALSAAGASTDAAQKDTFDELFRRMWQTTVQWACASGADAEHRAEDAATQAWYKAWKYRRKYDPAKGCYGTWLRSIVRNETSDLLRNSYRELPMNLADEYPAPRATIVGEPSLDSLSFVFDAFEALSEEKPEFARVLALKAQGYPDRQIGELLALASPGTVGSRLFRSKQYIAGRLARQGIVFLTEHANRPVQRIGLAPLCRTGDGSFYSFCPLSGLFVLPSEASAPPGSSAVGEGFFVKVWAYPLDRFEVRIREEASTEGAIFSWNQYAVYARNGAGLHATGLWNGGEERGIEQPVPAEEPPRRHEGNRDNATFERGSLSEMLDHCPAR